MNQTVDNEQLCLLEVLADSAGFLTAVRTRFLARYHEKGVKGIPNFEETFYILLADNYIDLYTESNEPCARLTDKALELDEIQYYIRKPKDWLRKDLSEDKKCISNAELSEKLLSRSLGNLEDKDLTLLYLALSRILEKL